MNLKKIKIIFSKNLILKSSLRKSNNLSLKTSYSTKLIKESFYVKLIRISMKTSKILELKNQMVYKY